MKQEDIFLQQFMNSELEKLSTGDSEKLKTLLAYVGLDTLNKLKTSSYSETDLKKIAGRLNSRFYSRMESQ